MLRLTNINTYYGDSHVLHDVSLSVESNELVGLLGRNGAGKTTTLSSIMGITPPETGTIEFEGDDIQGLAPYQTADRGIGYVPEEREVFPLLTVEENIKTGLNQASSPQERLEWLYDYFPVLAERRTQKAGTLSGGEQQMLAMARALGNDNVSLLLLDEASEGLAPQIIEDIRNLIRTLHQDTDLSVLIVEQNLDFALSLVDRVYVINKGHITDEIAASALAEDEELQREHLGVSM